MKHEIKLHYNFIEDLKFVVGFVSKMAQRPLLTGVNVGIENGEVYLAATDSYRLVKTIIGTVENEEINYSGNAFPSDFFNFISKTFKKSSGTLIIDTELNQLSFKLGSDGPNYTVSKIIGNYPSIDKLIVKEKELEFKGQWVENFIYKFKNLDLYTVLPIKTENGNDIDIHIKPKYFDPIVKMFKMSKTKIWHQNSKIRVVTFDFESTWKYTVIILPVRVD